MSSEPRKPLAEEHFEPIVEDGATNLEEVSFPLNYYNGSTDSKDVSRFLNPYNCAVLNTIIP